MFEQATLTGGPLSTRLWSTCAGMTGQAILVGAALLVPLIWPAALPQLQSYVTLATPGPPLPPPPPGPNVRPKGTVKPFLQVSGRITIPVSMPDHPAMIVDDPPEVGGGGVPGGVPGGIPGGVPGSIVDSVIQHAYVPPPPPPPAPVRAPVQTAAPPAPPIRIPISSVQLGAPIHRVEPVYPRMAVTTRVEGVVHIEAVVGIDGRIRELKAKSGHPFLVPAAIDAVRQWIYTPTLLNGKPVEVIAPITVTFKLGNR